MRLCSKIFGMASLAMGLYGCAEAVECKPTAMRQKV